MSSLGWPSFIQLNWTVCVNNLRLAYRADGRLSKGSILLCSWYNTSPSSSTSPFTASACSGPNLRPNSDIDVRKEDRDSSCFPAGGRVRWRFPPAAPVFTPGKSNHSPNKPARTCPRGNAPLANSTQTLRVCRWELAGYCEEVDNYQAELDECYTTINALQQDKEEVGSVPGQRT